MYRQLLKSLDKKTMREMGQWLEGKWGEGRKTARTDHWYLQRMNFDFCDVYLRNFNLSRQSPNRLCLLSPKREHGIVGDMSVVSPGHSS